MSTESTTPEFLRWALKHDCGLRAGCDGSDPERVDRQLRPLRTCVEALAVGRQHEGFCFEAALDAPPGPTSEPAGFRAFEVLEAYELVGAAPWQCRDCPAALADQGSVGRAASCFGMVDWTNVADQLPRAVDEVLLDPVLGPALRTRFLPTSPAWYGWWVDSPLNDGQLDTLTTVFGAFVERGPVWREAFGELHRALQVAAQRRLVLHVSYGPAGHCTGRNWIVVSHCRRCKASRPAGQRACSTCGEAAAPVAARRRLRRGRRPFGPLSQLLHHEASAALLAEYLALRGWPVVEIESLLSTFYLSCQRSSTR